jgi:hypothetical protein
MDTKETIVTPNYAYALVVSTTALRVFTPDVRRLTRCLLRTGVRVGAAALVEDRRQSTDRPASPNKEARL